MRPTPLRDGKGFAIVLLAAVCAAVPFPGRAAGLTDAQSRGRRIYEEGVGRAPVRAVLAATGLEAPGSAFPCINCHTEDGSGTSEGGVRSADIRWKTLADDVPGVRGTGRTHPPYSEETLKRAITRGKDPAGKDLDEAHPRYAIGPADLEDLAAFIKVLGGVPVPGVADDAVRIGVLLPERGPLADAGLRVRDLLSRYFEAVNARGGVFRRALKLIALPFDPGRPGSAADAARGAVADVFCFLANVGVPSDDEAARFLSASKVPVIVPLQVADDGGYGADRYTFHAIASVPDQARVAVDFLAERLPGPSAGIGLVYAEDRSGREGAKGVREQVRKHPMVLSVEIPFVPGALAAPSAVEKLREHNPGAVVYLGGGRDFLGLLEEADRRQWQPLFVAPAPMVGGSIQAAPGDSMSSVFLVSPLAPPDSAAGPTTAFAELERNLGAPGEHRSFLLLAFAGAMVLEEGLTRAGHAVTRESFVKRVEALNAFRTGVLPPLTFGANRRVGASGASVLRVDPARRRLVPASPWTTAR